VAPTRRPTGPFAKIDRIKHSSHRKEAIELVRFMIRAQIHSNREESAVVNQPETHNVSSASDERHNPETSGRNTARLVVRPSGETGTHYEQVTRAYIDAVHSVLTGEKSAPEAAGGLEKELVRITELKAGPPSKRD
jgi:trehalose/maltose transport system substrate-binding protein